MVWEKVSGTYSTLETMENIQLEQSDNRAGLQFRSFDPEKNAGTYICLAQNPARLVWQATTLRVEQ